MKETRPLLSLRRAAREYHLDPKLLAEAGDRGELRVLRLREGSPRRYVHRADLDDWLRRQVAPARDPAVASAVERLVRDLEGEAA